MSEYHGVPISKQPFARVWTYIALEQSINLDYKSKGGIIGISQKPGALECFCFTSHDRASITTALKDMCGIKDSDRVGPHQEAASRRKQ
jgi:hypothetical protein